MAGTPSKAAPRKGVTTAALQLQINELREQLVGVRRNKELGALVGRHNGRINQLQTDLDVLKVREESARAANFAMLQEEVAKAVVEFANGPLMAAHADLVTLIDAEKTRNDEQDTEIGALKVTTNAHGTEITMLNQGQQSLHKRVSVLESEESTMVILSLIFGAFIGLLVAWASQTIYNSNLVGEIIIGVGAGAVAMAVFALVGSAVRRASHKEKDVVVKTKESENVKLDIMQPRDAETVNIPAST